MSVSPRRRKACPSRVLYQNWIAHESRRFPVVEPERSAQPLPAPDRPMSGNDPPSVPRLDLGGGSVMAAANRLEHALLPEIETRRFAEVASIGTARARPKWRTTTSISSGEQPELLPPPTPPLPATVPLAFASTVVVIVCRQARGHGGLAERQLQEADLNGTPAPPIPTATRSGSGTRNRALRGAPAHRPDPPRRSAHSLLVIEPGHGGGGAPRDGLD
jgi:hypothetical protein